MKFKKKTPEQEQEEHDELALEALRSGVNPNPEFTMKPPNEDFCCVGSLNCVLFGPSNIDELMVPGDKARSEWYKQSKEARKHTPIPEHEFRGKHPEWGYPINTDVNDPHVPKSTLWNAGIMESLIFESFPVIAAVLRASKEGFRQSGIRRVQTAIRLHVVPLYKARHEEEERKRLAIAITNNPQFDYGYKDANDFNLDEDWPVMREAILKAVPLIAEWTCACFCYEVSFWSSVLSPHLDRVKQEEGKVAADGSTSTGMKFKTVATKEVSTGNPEPESETNEPTILAAARRRRQKRQQAGEA